MDNKTKDSIGNILRKITWISFLVLALIALFPEINPFRISKLITTRVSLLTVAVDYKTFTADAYNAINIGGFKEYNFVILQIIAILVVLSVIVGLVGSGLMLGNKKFKKLSYFITSIASGVGVLALSGVFFVYTSFANFSKTSSFTASIPIIFYIFLFLFILVLICSLTNYFRTKKPEANIKYEMPRGAQLFLMFMPFAALIFVFSYLPLWGWRYAFFDYNNPGLDLSWDMFVGFKKFAELFGSPGQNTRVLRVIGNTLVMSGLGILTSVLPMMFAVLLSEVSSSKFKRFVQVFTTIPNFISWVIVYSLAYAIFSQDGFVSGLLGTNTDYLAGDSFSWIKMLLWGTWKGLGWSAIIYIAAISSIDPVLYEAADIDGANRFQKMFNITIPQLMPTFFVLLILSVANILSNGMDQYYVFSNADNKFTLEVLDLYVYNIGIGESTSLAYATIVGMLKSIISIILLFTVNAFSKRVRGESII